MVEPIQVDYNTQLEPLAELLSKVKRPGDFYAAGTLEAPLPRLELEGVGTISFPLPESQAKEIIRRAEQAPYGRGQETVVDPKVRKVWQVPADKVRIGGKSWEQTLATILQRVAAGMSFKPAEVTAELYKLLLYDAGSFFLAHRDTEKAAGMFGTLVLVLPSLHQGGELVVRHAGREVTLDLRTREVSELAFAAFYADCEHEVRKVTAGNRLCLVYNLIQKPSKKRRPLLAAPDYTAEIERAARLLKDWGEEPDSPPKLAYLLEHQYSPAGLSFAGLKNADAALGKVLCAAARHAGLAIHLGIVHLEESGAAESYYDPYYSRRRRYGGYDEEEEEEAEEDVNADFEIVEVCDADQYIDSWVSPTGAAADYGKIPLGEGELLPQGALEGEPPDQQRVTEATGNEGASFERSYHRAALVLWRQDRYPEVLLQGGVQAALPYLRERIRHWSGARKRAKSPAAAQELTSLAQLILDHWKSKTPGYGYAYAEPKEAKPPPRTVMLGLLRRMGNVPLLKEFVGRVVVSEYDGNENAELLKASALLGPSAAGDLFTAVFAKNMPLFAVAGAELLSQLVQQPERKPAPDWAEAYRQMAAAAVESLSKIKQRDTGYDEAVSAEDWVRSQKAQPVSAALVAHLFDALWRLGASDLSETAAHTIMAHPKLFAPDTVLVPALKTLRAQHPRRAAGDPAFQKLWQQAAEFLLERSEFPPAEPADWAQPAQIGCKCEDCRELQAFARNPAERVHRFRVAKERRRHLHATIDSHQLDMTHETERVGLPQTLVCTKTRKHFQERCRQYAREVDLMKQLAALGEPLPGPWQDLVRRLRQAIARSEGSA